MSLSYNLIFMSIKIVVKGPEAPLPPNKPFMAQGHTILKPPLDCRYIFKL